MVAYKASLGPLNWLTDRLSRIVVAAAGAVTSARERVNDFRGVMRDNLMDFTIASYMAGSGDLELSAEAMKVVKAQVETQITALDGFAGEIASGELSEEAIASRASMYANSLQASYWGGALADIPYPALPGQDTECLSNCHCTWRVEEVDAEAGDYDLHWELGDSKAHCSTCQQRAREWAPYKVRGGKLEG